MIYIYTYMWLYIYILYVFNFKDMFENFPGFVLVLPKLFVFFGISHHRNMNDAGVGQALEPPPMMALVSKGNPEGTCEQMWSTLNAILLNVILWIYDIYLYSIIYIYVYVDMIVFVRFLYMFAYILISIQYIQGTSLPAAFWRTIQDLNKQSRVAVDFPTAESRNFPISWNRVTEAAISCWPSHWWGTSQRIISQEDRTFESFEFSANFFCFFRRYTVRGLMVPLTIPVSFFSRSQHLLVTVWPVRSNKSFVLQMNEDTGYHWLLSTKRFAEWRCFHLFQREHHLLDVNDFETDTARQKVSCTSPTQGTTA